MTQTLYPRTISIYRPKTNAGTIGLTSYSGVTTNPADPNGPTTLFTGIAASIQAKQTGRKKDGALPEDVVFAPTWYIYTSKTALPAGAVKDRDIIIDDAGYRYEVAQNYYNNLGYQLRCIRLEA